MALRDDVGERAHARVGSVLRGKWRLDAVIGLGGMACVFAATHRNQSRVAIKMLHPEIALDKDITARFLREGYVANAVGHPGTVAVLDDDIDEGAPFLVMELLEGETLDARLVRTGAFSYEEVASVAEQLLDVLAAAHDKQIIHRDIKPENLFVTREGRIKVLDFGIARLRELSFSTGGGTRPGSVLGTPAFMAPEQALGRWSDVDGRTDIWAVGATLYTLASGRYVHEADTVQAQLVLAATRSARSLARIVREAPPDLVELVDRALAFERDDRWPDARAMQAALRLTGPGASARTPVGLGAVSGRQAVLVQGPTLVAPPESYGTGPGYSAQAVSRSAPGSTKRSTGARFGLVASIVGLIALGTVGVRWLGPTTPPAPVSEPPSSRAPSTAPGAEHGVTASEPPPAPPTLDLAKTPVDAPGASVPSTVKPVVAAARPPVIRHPGKSKPAPSANTTAAIVENPFDRRH